MIGMDKLVHITQLGLTSMDNSLNGRGIMKKVSRIFLESRDFTLDSPGMGAPSMLVL